MRVLLLFVLLLLCARITRAQIIPPAVARATLAAARAQATAASEYATETAPTRTPFPTATPTPTPTPTPTATPTPTLETTPIATATSTLSQAPRIVEQIATHESTSVPPTTRAQSEPPYVALLIAGVGLFIAAWLLAPAIMQWWRRTK